MARQLVKTVKNAKLYDDGAILIENVRASYPHLDKPWKKETEKNKDQDPKYSLTGLGDKDTHGEMKDLCVEVINGLLKSKNMGKLGADKKFIRDGDNAGKDECDGQWTIAASEVRPISVRDERGHVMTDAKLIASKFYAGCVVHMLIKPWAQVSDDYGNRINASLVAVKFVGDGERIGEAPITDEGVFDEEPGGDEFADDDDL